MGKREGLPVYLRGEQAVFIREMAKRTGITATTYVRLAVEFYKKAQSAE